MRAREAKTGDVVPEDFLMSRGHQMTKLMTILAILAWGVSSWAGTPAAGFDLRPAASRGLAPGLDGPEWALSPQGPGWLRVPQMQVRLDPAPLGAARVWVEGGIEARRSLQISASVNLHGRQMA